MEALLAVFSVLLAASYSQAAGVNETGVTSSQLDVVASQPQTVSCAAPAPLGQYDKYCEGLQAEYFLLPKQKVAPSLTNLKPNITSFVTSLNQTAAAMSLKAVNQLVAAKTYSIAVRYTGVLFVDQTGEYQFSLNSPAGTRLTVNGNTVTFNEGSNSSTPTTGYNFGTAGYIPVEMVFFDENAVPSLTATWQGPSSTIFTVIEGNSIMFNCTSIQNMTNSVPATSSGLCTGLSAVYYADWANSSYASATGVATFAVYEPALNHWSTTTTPSWSGLPTTLSTDFAARYHGQLWVPIAGTYTFKLYADTSARLFVGTQNILNATANAANVAISQSVSYTFATPGYVPVGLNFVSRKSSEAGVLRLVWKGPNSPVFGVTTPFSHPCSTFVACANSTTAGALPQEVVGAPPAGSTIESVTAISSSSLATYVPNSNVTFTLGFPSLTADDPNVEDVAYFVREAVANAAGLKLESVWTVPSIDSTTGQVVFPLGAYFTTLAGAQKFYNLVNLHPQTIFSESAGLSDFYPITVSSPALGTTVAAAAAVQPARSMAILDSATGEDDTVPLPPVSSPTPAASPVMTTANTTAVAASPSPTAAASAEAPATPAPAPAPSTIFASAPFASPTTTSPSSSLPSPYTPSTILAPVTAPVSAPLASPLVYTPHSHPLIPASATAPAPGPTIAYPLPSAPVPSSPPTMPTPGVAAPSLLPPSKTPTATPSIPKALLPADALPVYAPVVVPGSYAVDGVFVPGPPVTAPSNGGSYFVPYAGHAGGYQVPFPSLTSPSSPPVYGLTPSGLAYAAGSSGQLFGAPGSTPSAMSPGFGPAPSFSLVPGVPGSAPGPYGSPVASPYAGKTYFVPYPEGVGGYMVPYPAGYGSSTPSRNLGAAVTPAAAPASSALCACNPKDTTPRSVKIEVLSTAYNSTATDTINFNAYLTFTHPTKSLNSSQVRVFTRQPTDSSGTVTTPGVVTLLQPISQNCAFYSLKGYVTESNPFIVNSTDIYLAAGGDILDACGQPFNVTVTQVQQTHRLEGLLYATGVAYSESAGVLLDTNELDLALAFTDSVPLLNASMFTVTGPSNMSTTELQTVDSSDAYYTFSVTVPDNYYGSITVAMDKAGQDYLTSINSAAVAPAALTISRVDPLQQGDLVNSTMTKAARGL
ncbi:hypothetical protein WJX79_011109 [Trebouxia sp. C0005]